MKKLKISFLISFILVLALLLSACGFMIGNDKKDDPKEDDPTVEPGGPTEEDPKEDPSEPGENPEEPGDNPQEEVSYTISFMLGESVYTTLKTKGNEELTLPVVNEEGKAFEGWFTDKAYTNEFTKDSLKNTKLEANMEVYAKMITLGSLDISLTNFILENNVYKYTLKADVNTLDLANFIKVSDNTTYKIYKNNLEVTSTLTLVDGNNEYKITVNNGKDSKDYNINVYKVIYYTLTFNTNGGTSVSSMKVEENTKVTAPTTTKIGYTFVSWSYDFSKAVTSSMTINATFKAIEYTIEYYDGSTKLSLTPSKYTIENEVTLPTYSKTGYDFLGWYTDSTFKTKVTKINKGTTGNIKYYAKVEEQAPTYASVNIKYNLNGGKLSDTTSVVKTEKANIGTYLEFDSNGYKACLVKTASYTYWYYIVLKATSEANTYTILEIVYQKSNITASSYDYVIGWHGDLKDSTKSILMDVWTNKTDYVNGFAYLENVPSSATSSASISVCFSKAKEESPSVITVSEPFTLPTPTKDGCTFKGWLSSLDNKVTFTYPGYSTSQSTITYTATWESNSSSKVAQAKENLNVYMTKYSEVSENITLPTSQDGCTLTWSSSDISVLSNSGVISSNYASSSVTLTCKISDGTEEETCTYIVKVLGSMKDLSKGVVGGYLYFSQSNIDEYTYKNLDIIYIAFAYIQPDGSIQNYSSIKSYCTKITTNAHKYGTRVIISFQHKTALTDFSTVAASQELCNTFADNVVKLINEVGFDGADMDWEWPTSAQATTFTTLVKTLNQKIKANNPNHLLTAACGSYQSSRYDLNNSKQYLDYINLMTYDMQVSKASHHNALYSSTGNSSYYCDGSVTAYLKYVSASKLVLGIPFYGRVFGSATTGMGSGSYTKAVGHTYIHDTYLNTAENIAKYRVWDDKAKVPYIYDQENNIVITYDDTESISIKCTYAKTKGLAGVMYWQDSQDYGNTLLGACVDGIAKNYK